MSAGQYCGKCRTAVAPGGVFCSRCGAPVTAPSAGPMTFKEQQAQARPAKKGGQIKRPSLIVVGLAGLYAVWVAATGGDAGGAGSALGQPTPTPPSLSAAVYLDPRVLAANPSGYTGKNIYVQGKALNVTQKPSYTWVQMMAQPVGKSDTESVIVEMPFQATDLVKGECFRIYGVAHGTQDVTRTLTGAKDSVPLLNGYAYSSSSSDKYGSCLSPPSTR